MGCHFHRNYCRNNKTAVKAIATVIPCHINTVKAIGAVVQDTATGVYAATLVVLAIATMSCHSQNNCCLGYNNHALSWLQLWSTETMHCHGHKCCLGHSNHALSWLQQLLSWPQQPYTAAARSVVLVIVTICTVLATTTVVLTIASMNCHGHNYCCGCSHHALTKPQHVLS